MKTESDLFIREPEGTAQVRSFIITAGDTREKNSGFRISDFAGAVQTKPFSHEAQPNAVAFDLNSNVECNLRLDRARTRA